MSNRCSVTDLTFPVLAFSKYGLLIKRHAEELETEFKAAFDDGIFADLLIVDASGKTLRVVDARSHGGAGRLWGYSLVYSRRLKIELDLESTEKQWTLEEVRTRVLEDFRDWHGWESRDDFNELRNGVSRAQSIRELAGILAALESPRNSSQV